MNDMNAKNRYVMPSDESVKELEFQVSSILNRLEEAVEKFDNKGTINDLEVEPTLHFIPKSPQEIINVIQDAIVNLNLSKDDEEPNLAILPALRDVDKLALVSHSIKHYVLCLDVAHSDYLINWIENETSKWLAQMFGFADCHVFYDENYLEGYVKLFRFLLLKKYPTYNKDGFEAFKQSFPVIYYDSPAMFVVAQYICCRTSLPVRFVQEVPSFTYDPNDYAEVFSKIIDVNKNKNQIPILFLANAETAIQPAKCNILKLRSLCNEYNIWLHLTGSSIAVLPILQRKGYEGLFRCVSLKNTVLVLSTELEGCERKHESMATMVDLPAEVLLHIFEYLPLKDLFSLKYVQKDWVWLTTFKSLYKAIVVDTDVKLDQLLRILTAYSKIIETVAISNREDANNVLKFLADCTNLKCLKMENCSGSKNECVSTALLINVFKKTKLSDFSMTKCTCFVHVLSILPPEPRTRKMIGFSSSGTDSATQDLHFVGPQFLLMLETSFDSLTCLRIEDANINFLTTDFTSLFRLIGNCRKMKELSYHVCYLPITDENFRQIYALNSLTSLSLKSLRRVSDEILQNFFCINRTSSIRKLELFDLASLDESLIRCIGTACPNLENLTLCQCADTKQRTLTKEVLLELPQVCKMLQVLRLSYLDNTMADVLVFLSKKLSYLKLLEIEALTNGECIVKLKSILSEAMPHFDVMLSHFGRVTCQPKRRYFLRNNILSQNYQLAQQI